MGMYIKVTPSIFFQTFQQDDLRKGAFSYSGAEALLDFYDECEIDAIFDPIALAGEWYEIEDADSLIEKFSDLVDEEEFDDEEEVMEALLDELKSETTVLETRTGGYVVAVI